MATVKAFIRTTTKNDKVKIRFRLTDGRNVQLFYVSDIEVLPNLWDSKKEEIKAKVACSNEKRLELKKSVNGLKDIILSIYSSNKDITSKDLKYLVDRRLYPEKYKSVSDNFFNLFSDFLEMRKFSEIRRKQYDGLIRALHRYELVRSVEDNMNYRLDIASITADDIGDFESFLRNEHVLCKEYANIYEIYPSIIATRRKQPIPKPRGNNTIAAIFKRLRTFLNWCVEKNIIDKNPAGVLEMAQERYGTPYYLTLEERNLIANFDLSSHPHLVVQRDIFIFQCLIGCRVSDLLKMTHANIINEAVEYIPHKTKDERPIVVRVPLNERAKMLIDKYKEVNSKGKLFPFISAQKYNDDIKEIFRVCGITRLVTVLNPTTGKEEKKPINEIASSHLARRTFIGNLYKKVKDPNLIGSMSGHKEGSRAFARYRDIDDDIKREVVKLIE